MPVAEGKSPDPPMAWSTRQAMSTHTFGATAHSSELSVNRNTQTRKTRLRPKLSLNLAMAGCSATCARVYPASVQVISGSVVSSSVIIVGSATATIELSMENISTLMTHSAYRR